jgi:hypothetical protein
VIVQGQLCVTIESHSVTAELVRVRGSREVSVDPTTIQVNDNSRRGGEDLPNEPDFLVVSGDIIILNVLDDIDCVGPSVTVEPARKVVGPL